MHPRVYAATHWDLNSQPKHRYKGGTALFVFPVRATETCRLSTKPHMPAHKGGFAGIDLFEPRSNPLRLNLADLRSAPDEGQCQTVLRGCIKPSVGAVLKHVLTEAPSAPCHSGVAVCPET